MAYIHFLNNKWLKEEDLKISAFDLAILRGYAVFDFLRTYHGKPFILDKHIDRLFNSAKILGIKPEQTKAQITKLVLEGLKKNYNGHEELNIRIILTGGISEDSVSPGEAQLIIMYTPAKPYPTSYYKEGIKLITTHAKRSFPHAKSSNYLLGIIALTKAKDENAVDSLYVDEYQEIYECITSNFFAVIDNTLVTPDADILIGVTRGVVLKIAEEQDIKVKLNKLFVKNIPKFQEAFITASNKEIVPVVKIDSKAIGNGKVGPITKKLIEEYRKITSQS